MLREDCRVGMRVVCGRPNGEKTVGEVVEVHEKKAEVRTLETRGDGNRGAEEHRTKKQPAGTVWSFTFDLIEPLDGRLLEALRSLPPKDERLLEYLERGSESLVEHGHGRACMSSNEQTAILQAICVNHRHRKAVAVNFSFQPAKMDYLLEDLNQRLGLLFEALGRPVSESVSRAWEDDQRINQEIDAEFRDANDRIKAQRHWHKIREHLPDDRDHEKRILLWNERRLSPAWIEAGLNEPSTAAHRLPAPRPLDWVRRSTPTLERTPPTFEQRRQAWKEQNEPARNQTATHGPTSQTP